jgi:hypothetical protein
MYTTLLVMTKLIRVQGNEWREIELDPNPSLTIQFQALNRAQLYPHLVCFSWNFFFNISFLGASLGSFKWRLNSSTRRLTRK